MANVKNHRNMVQTDAEKNPKCGTLRLRIESTICTARARPVGLTT
jgi:hypothetical protein